MVDATEDPGIFTDSGLSAYRAVIFLLTTGHILEDAQQRAFERYIAAGNGFVGVHSAADTEYDWAWYGGLMGAYFGSHPDIQPATIHREDTDHPSTASLPDVWVRTDAIRERRTSPFSAVWDDADPEPFEPSVEPERFRPDDGAWPGGWVSFPRDWNAPPHERLLSKETHAHILACIDALPAGQREVVVLRDLHGCSPEETCTFLHIAEVNQRVLLHRARSRLRRALEPYLCGT
jgi:RNA polymerase sigma factor (sigma-70 family)